MKTQRKRAKSNSFWRLGEHLKKESLTDTTTFMAKNEFNMMQKHCNEINSGILQNQKMLSLAGCKMVSQKSLDIDFWR
jgi:hypothetical protein